GAHLTLFPAVLDELRGRGGADIPVFGGGIIPDEDRAALRAAGVAELFGPGTSTQEIVDWVHGTLRRAPDSARSTHSAARARLAHRAARAVRRRRTAEVLTERHEQVVQADPVSPRQAAPQRVLGLLGRPRAHEAEAVA